MLTRRALAQAISRALATSSASKTFAAAVATTLFATVPVTVQAQSNIEGYVYGTAQAGSEVRLENPSTGYTRTATAQKSGLFRTPNVPPGIYKVTFTDSSGKQVTRDVVVAIGAGTSVEASVETVVVTGTSIRPVDMTKTESVTTLTADTIDALPVARDVQQVALLAPGVIEGDAGFTSQSGKPLVSFGGASPGENAYYINGMNITDFRNFLGGATVPYEFYDQFEVRTGGYSAEFGRSLGGVINAVTKRGTNNFEFGASAYWQPDALTRKRPNATYIDPDTGERVIRTDNSNDYRSDWQLNLSAGGPIVQDKLFFYVMGVARTNRQDDAVGTTSFVETTDDSPFFGGKLDWQIADNHSLEYTYFRDDTSTDVDNYNYDAYTGQRGTRKSIGTRDEGGQTQILRYSGSLMDNLTLSALAGRNERQQSSKNVDAVTGNPCTLVVDARAGNNPLSCWDSSGTGQVSDTEDTRDAYRLDITWILGDHALKFGYDYEKDSSKTDVEYEGGVGYRYVNSTPGSTLNGGIVPAGATSLVRQRFYSVTGDFEQKLSAFYIEDSWQMTDRLLVSLGLRNETLENFNKDGEEFLDFGEQLTPRLGFSFDLLGDGRTKLYGNAGRYTMPIATNTNIRFAGGEFFTEQYYTFSGMNADGTPILGTPVGSLRTLSNGVVPVPAETVDSDIDPMYQDEYILGIQSQITDSTTVGLKLTHRDLVRAVEDSAFVDANDNFLYFLFNPGQDVHLALPDGTTTTVTAEELGYPEAERKYYAAEFSIDQSMGETLRIGGSYTWSHTYGNFEGVFQSDVQQDDAGITINFDTPGMALYSHGDLPNDRRHQIKFYGTWSPTPEWTMNFNAYALSGRPKNMRGNCPADIDPDAYDGDCFFVGGEPAPRASAGRLPWLYNLNLGVRYTPAFYDKLSMGLDIFNVFNFHKETRIQEVAEFPDGTPDPTYGVPVYFQDPMYTRFNVRWNF
jgi:outer membrane receptor for ferrienterochelin and colicin